MKQVGPYQLDRRLGKGATAVVYRALKATDTGPKEFAVKVFHPGFFESNELRRRILAEFRAAETLKHPNVVQVVESLLDNDPAAVVMEFVDGAPLDQFQARLPYVLPELSARLIMDVLSGLSHAHGKGIIHRDLKPANIIVDHTGRTVITDLGLARMIDVSTMTLSGTILGSPDFMSPEQARGERCTERSDLFSASAILYFLVTGTKPFTRSSPLATLAAVCNSQPEPPQARNPKLSAELSALILKGLSKDPSLRFQSADEMREALSDYLKSLELQPENFSVAAFLAEPTPFLLGAMQTIAESLEKKAEAAIASESLESFHRLLSHLSSIAPESTALDRLLEMQALGQRRARTKKRWAWAGASLLILLGFGFGASQWVKIQSTVHTPAQAVVTSAPQSTAEVLAQQVPAAASVAASQTSSAQAAPARKPVKDPGLVGKGVVKFDVGREIEVFWDGVRVDMAQGLPKQKAGIHRIRLVRPGMRPMEQNIVVRSDEPTEIRVR